MSRWMATGEDLPPDLTSGPVCCRAQWGRWVCTRRPGHTGRHAAGTGTHIVAVWP